MIYRKKIHTFLFALSAVFTCDAFTPIGTNSRLATSKQSSTTSISAVRSDDHEGINKHVKNKGISMASLSLATLVSLSAMTTTPLTVQAYDDYDDVDTVETTIQALKDATGSVDASFKVFESINEIITEGKGVGGSLSASE